MPSTQRTIRVLLGTVVVLLVGLSACQPASVTQPSAAGPTTVPPTRQASTDDMALIPAGWFSMGRLFP